jgi:hypothetical protein
VNKGYGAREITDLIFIFLFVSLFPLEIVPEDADTFLMPQGYVKLNIPILSLSSLHCKANNSIISCQELRCITVNSFICCKVIQQVFPTSDVNLAKDTPKIYRKINTELHCSKDEAELLFLLD